MFIRLRFNGSIGLAVGIQVRDCLDGHGVGDHVLQHVADRRQKSRDHIPCLDRHDRPHALRITDQADHDQEASGDQRGTDVDESGLVAPDEIDDMAQRHLRRPGDARPEAESGQELGRKTEVLLDEEGTDDAGQPRNAGGGVDHQWR